MDFASRHAAAEAATSAAASAAAPAGVAEEPEYLARYLVVKHSWRGRYRRVLCIASSGVVTLDPTTLNLTNSYDAGSEFDHAEALAATDEFTLAVRTDARGKFKPMRFSSPLRPGILTELHRLRPVQASFDFPVLHLRRRTHEWAPFVSTSPSSIPASINFTSRYYLLCCSAVNKKLAMQG
jgi:DnaJ family protein C protein 13